MVDVAVEKVLARLPEENRQYLSTYIERKRAKVRRDNKKGRLAVVMRSNDNFL